MRQATSQSGVLVVLKKIIVDSNERLYFSSIKAPSNHTIREKIEKRKVGKPECSSFSLQVGIRDMDTPYVERGERIPTSGLNFQHPKRCLAVPVMFATICEMRGILSMALAQPPMSPAMLLILLSHVEPPFQGKCRHRNGIDEVQPITCTHESPMSHVFFVALRKKTLIYSAALTSISGSATNGE